MAAVVKLASNEAEGECSERFQRLEARVESIYSKMLAIFNAIQRVENRKRREGEEDDTC